MLLPDCDRDLVKKKIFKHNSRSLIIIRLFFFLLEEAFYHFELIFRGFACQTILSYFVGIQRLICGLVIMDIVIVKTS